jgi:outer membrane lipoprotein-sorting protein
LGTELDFQKVQNLLLGHALFDLRQEKYDISSANENYQLTPKKSMELFQALFQIEPKNYRMASQQLSQPLKKRLLEVNYKTYQKINKWVLPNTIFITAIDGNLKNTIDIEYRNIEFDQKLSFPYKIPKGYKEIVLNKNDI